MQDTIQYTHKMLWKVGDKIIETWHETESWETIKTAVKMKNPMIEAGDGQGYSWIQYRGYKSLTEKEKKQKLSTTFIREGITREVSAGCEWEVRLYEEVDKKTKEVIHTRKEKKLINKFTQEEIKRHQQWIAPWRDIMARKKAAI